MNLSNSNYHFYQPNFLVVEVSAGFLFSIKNIGVFLRPYFLVRNAKLGNIHIILLIVFIFEEKYIHFETFLLLFVVCMIK